MGVQVVGWAVFEASRDDAVAVLCFVREGAM